MPQQLGPLADLAQGYMPLAAGVPIERRTGFEGLPGMQGPLAPFAIFAMPLLQQMMGQAGMTPLGLGHDQNVYDVMRSMNYTQMQRQLMQMSSQRDRASYMRTAQGLAALTGTPFGFAQRQAAGTFADFMASASPILAEIAPDFTDQLAGGRGSAAVMTRHILEAGRYRIDPLTGRLGVSAETASATAQQLHAELFSDANFRGMQGFRAGQVGAMMEQMQLRGMLPGMAAERPYLPGMAAGDRYSDVFRAADDMLRRDRPAFDRMTARAGVDASQGLGRLSPEDLDKLQLDPAMADRLRSFDVERVKRSIQGYSQAIAAMRDVMGDAGHPNAPIPQLIASLEAMTMGASSQLDPARLGMIVRETYNLARQSGVPLGNAVMLQQHAADRANKLGLEPIFGIQAAQGSLAFGGAYRAQGHAAFTAWGAMNADQLTQLDANLRVQAAGSNLANRMAVVMRLRDQTGGFQAGSELGNYAEAIANGLNQFQGANGQMRSVSLTDTDFVRMLSRGRGTGGALLGLSEADIRDLIGQRATNREYVERYRLGDMTRVAQRDELQFFVGASAQNVVADRIRDTLIRQGMSDQQAMQIAQRSSFQVGQGVSRSMFDMSTEEVANNQLRNQAIGNRLEQELRASGAGRVLNRMSEEERQQFLTTTAERIYGHVNRAIAGSQYRSFENFQNVHRTMNRATLDESQRATMTAHLDAQAQEALSPIGKGSMLSRAIDAIQGTDPNDPNALMRVIGSSLGGVKTDDLNQALQEPVRQLQETRNEIDNLRRKLENAPGNERAALLQQIEARHKALRGHAEQLANVGERHGLFAEKGLDPTQLDSTLEALHESREYSRDLVGVRTGAGREISPKQIQDRIAAAQKAGRALTERDAEREILGEREAVQSRPDKKETDRFAKQATAFKNGAFSQMNADLRARRFGIDNNEIETEIKAGAGSREEAIQRALDKREAAFTSVSDSERKALQAEREKAGKDVLSPKEEEAEILGRKATAQRERFDAVWKSETGGIIRRDDERAQALIGETMVGLTQSPSLARLGMRAVEYHQQLKTGMQRQQDLAQQFTGGDVTRLRQGDVGNTPEAIAAWKETSQLMNREYEIVQNLRGQVGREGQQFNPEEEADRVLNKLDLSPGERRAKRDELVQGLATLKGMKPGAEKAFEESEQLRAGLAPIAGKLGVSVDDIKEATGSSRKTAELRKRGLSDQEGRRLEQVRGKWQAAKKQTDKLTTSIQQFEGRDNLSRGEKRQLAELRRNLRVASQRQQGFESQVARDADRFGQSAGEYLSSLHATQSQIDSALSQANQLEAKERELASQGVSPEKAGAARSAGQLQRKAIDQAVAEESESGESTYRRLLKAAGIAQTGPLSAAEQEVAERFAGDKGKAYAASVIEKENLLKDRAQQRKGGIHLKGKVSTLTREFEKAEGDETKMAAFAERYGIETADGKLTDKGKKDLGQLREAIRFQQEALGDRRGSREDVARSMLQAMDKGTKPDSQVNRGGDGNQGGKLVITGEVTINDKRGKIDLTEVGGGTRAMGMV